MIRNDGDLYCQIVFRNKPVMTWGIRSPKEAMRFIDSLNTEIIIIR